MVLGRASAGKKCVDDRNFGETRAGWFYSGDKRFSDVSCFRGAPPVAAEKVGVSKGKETLIVVIFLY